MKLSIVLTIIQLCVLVTCYVPDNREENWYPVDTRDEYLMDNRVYRRPFPSRRRYADPFEENDMVPNFYEEIDENIKEKITGFENMPKVYPTHKEVATNEPTTAKPEATTAETKASTESSNISRNNTTKETKPFSENPSEETLNMKSQISDKDFEDYMRMKHKEDPLWFKVRRNHNKNVNINHNSNVNINSNHNSNYNSNTNVNTNSNYNSNVNINSNHNSNINTNINVNQNTYRPFYIGTLPKQWQICKFCTIIILTKSLYSMKCQFVFCDVDSTG